MECIFEGRRPDPYRNSNIAFVTKDKKLDPSQYNNAINYIRTKFLNAIKDHDEKLFNILKNNSLEYLKKVIDDNHIHVKSIEEAD
jgi:hypothetical protein